MELMSVSVIIIVLNVHSLSTSAISDITTAKFLKDNSDQMLNDDNIVTAVSSRSALECMTMCERTESCWTCSYNDNQCSLSRKWVGGGEPVISIPSSGALMYSGK